MLKDELKDKYNLLTPREQEIIDIISNNLEQLDNYNLENIANITYSSTSSISRLVQKLSMNYEEFKFLLNQHHQIIRPQQELLDKNIIKAATLIPKANRIFLVGVGQSSFLCHYLSMILFKIGSNNNALTDYDSINSISTFINSQDLIIFISSSGNTKTLTDLLDKLNTKNVNKIAITGNEKSIISNHVDVSLHAQNTLISTSKFSFSLQGEMMIIIDKLIHYLVTQQ